MVKDYRLKVSVTFEVRQSSIVLRPKALSHMLFSAGWLRWSRLLVNQ